MNTFLNVFCTTTFVLTGLIIYLAITNVSIWNSLHWADILNYKGQSLILFIATTVWLWWHYIGLMAEKFGGSNAMYIMITSLIVLVAVERADKMFFQKL